MYKIVITKVATAKEIRRGEWTVVENRPWTSAEIAAAAEAYVPKSFVEKTPTKAIYGYTPEREATVQTEIEVLKQTVDALDLAAVIKAVNNL